MTNSGNLTTDFMKIKGGLFHKANGGYLLVQAQDILSTPQAWEALRRVMKTREINMDFIREQLGAVVAPTLKPEPIPANIKVIMIGSSYYYELLNEYDEGLISSSKFARILIMKCPLQMKVFGKLRSLSNGLWIEKGAWNLM